METYETMRRRFRVKLVGGKKAVNLLTGGYAIKHVCGEYVLAAYTQNPTYSNTLVYATRKIADDMRISEGALLHTAMKLTAEENPPLLMPLLDYSLGTRKNLFTESGEMTDSVYVLTNDRMRFGATVLFYPAVQERLAELFPEGYYVLPSSEHEVLIKRYDPVDDQRTLTEMVKEINQTTVREEDKLGDTVLMWNGKSLAVVNAV